jgi:dienelactone hydrolase
LESWLVGAAAAIMMPANAGAASDKPLTIEAGIEAVRPLTALSVRYPDGSAVSTGRGGFSYSPDGKSYVLLTIRGDLSKDGVWLDAYTGETSTLARAKRIRRVAHLFCKCGGDLYSYGAASLPLGWYNQAAWRDNGTFTLLWADSNDRAQVYSISLNGTAPNDLTKSNRPVNAYTFTPAGKLVYSVEAPLPDSQPLLARGFVVHESTDLIALLNGDVTGGNVYDLGGKSLLRMAREDQTSNRLANALRMHNRPIILSVDPTGQWLLVDGAPRSVPAHWRSYQDKLVADAVAVALSDGLEETTARALRQIYIVSLSDGHARALIDAPMIRAPMIQWGRDGNSVRLKGSLLPSRLLVSGEKQTGDLVVDIDDLTPRLVQQEPEAAGADRPAPAVRLEVLENATTPPQLRAIDARGQSALIFDFAASLRDSRLCPQRGLNWTVGKRRWSGTLYEACGIGQKPRPLVIQLRGETAQGAFSLYGGAGPGLGPGMSVFIAQALANRGISVLQLGRQGVDEDLNTPNEARAYLLGVEAAIDMLSHAGDVDPARIGLTGFSRGGWYVEYILAHSAAPFAAALVSDNIDAGYILSAALDWPQGFSRLNGAEPFGNGLANWLKEAPGFNIEKIRAPLRMHVESFGLPGVLQQWEVFSRLRRLGKPVELFVVPDVEHGSHGLQRPSQLLASQQGALDWFDFWLNGQVRGDAGLTQQYARWEQLRVQRDRLASEQK